MLLKLTFLIVIVLFDIYFIYGIIYMSKCKRNGYCGCNGTKSNVPLSNGGIFFLCFAEGYVIFTESKRDAVSVCKQAGLNPNPYWSSISIVYDTPAQANDAINQVRQMLGSSIHSFIKTEVVGLKLKVIYQGFVTTK